MSFLGMRIGVPGSYLGGVGLPSWVPNPANAPDLAFNFAINSSWNKATKAQPTAASLLTVSRASSGTVNDSLGNWTSVGSNLPRLSDLGLLVEEARTNSIRNNSMSGAVVMADGVELLTNGNFAAQGTGWTTNVSGGGSVVFSAGSVAITGNGVDQLNYISQQITGLVVGRNYVIAVAGPVGGVSVSVGTIAGGTTVLNAAPTQGSGQGGGNPDRVGFTATQTSHWITFSKSPASAVTLTSVSVQDGERVENGGFTANPVSASQSTVQNGWQWNINAGTGTVVLSSNTVQITGDGTHAANLGSMALPTVAGCTYTITADITGNTCNVQAGTTGFTAGLLSASSAVGTGQKFQFTATTSTSFISFAKTSAVTATIANVSVQSAGALPTNWTTAQNAGLVLSVASVGTESGINYFDFQVAGTSSGSNNVNLYFDGSQIATATYGQTWTFSPFIKISGGDLTNISAVDLGLMEWSSGGSQLVAGLTVITPSTSGTALGNARQSLSRTFTNSSTAYARGLLFLQIAAPPVAVNATFRVGWPQLENNSLVNSTVASAATAASGASGVNGSAVYSVGGGTGTAATLNVTWAAGVMTVNSVASAGSYTVFPPSPAALTYVSGTATGWTGATVTLTPTSNAAKAFATSPIVTTSAAATRASDVVTLTSPPTFGAAYSGYVVLNTEAPDSYGGNQAVIEYDDGTTNNRVIVNRLASTGKVALTSITSGVGGSQPTSVGTAEPNVTSKFAFAAVASDQAVSLNGETVATGSSVVPVVTSVRFGSISLASFPDGFISQAAIWASQRVPNAQLQSMTT